MTTAAIRYRIQDSECRRTLRTLSEGATLDDARAAAREILADGDVASVAITAETDEWPAWIEAVSL